MLTFLTILNGSISILYSSLSFISIYSKKNLGYCHKSLHFSLLFFCSDTHNFFFTIHTHVWYDFVYERNLIDNANRFFLNSLSLSHNFFSCSFVSFYRGKTHKCIKIHSLPHHHLHICYVLYVNVSFSTYTLIFLCYCSSSIHTWVNMNTLQKFYMLVWRMIINKMTRAKISFMLRLQFYYTFGEIDRSPFSLTF